MENIKRELSVKPDIVLLTFDNRHKFKMLRLRRMLENLENEIKIEKKILSNCHN